MNYNHSELKALCVCADWSLLLCGVLSSDAERLEDGLRRGHYRHSGSKEGCVKAAPGPSLHQLLSDHVSRLPCGQSRMREQHTRWEGGEGGEGGVREQL